MTERGSTTHVGEIEGVLALFAQGASLEEILGNLRGRPARRTVQRKLAAMERSGKVIVEGRGRATRYRLHSGDAGNLNRNGQALVLSPAALEIQRVVRAPIEQRSPIGYQREFLESYRPNRSFHLSVEVRRRLAEMGSLASENLPPGTYIREIYNRLLIDLSWNSSRLEGNTYSLLETERLLQLGESASGKDARDAQMILNHKRAIELLAEQADEIGFNRYTICNLHALLSDNLLTDPQAGGRVRSRAVGISGTVFHPLESPPIIEECFQQVLHTAEAITDPFEQAFFAMVQIPYLQPFEDVNKRVSRLAANIPMVRRNLCPLSFVDVPQDLYVEGILGVYELNSIDLLRDVFIWAYERSCARYSAVRQSLGEPDPFRMRYRELLGEVVRESVQRMMTKSQATAFVQERAAAAVPPDDQHRFVEIAETELMSLHEGNIARYHLRPTEYSRWKEKW